MAAARFVLLILSAAVFFLPGCALKEDLLRISPGQGVELVETPFFPQEKYQCGPASLAMLLSASGVDIRPEELAPLTYLPGRSGSLQLELIAAVRNFGRIAYSIDPELSSLIKELRAGRPVMVLQNLGLDSIPAYHYAVVIGALPGEKIVLRSGADKRVEMDADRFAMSWRRPGAWGIVVLRPGELPARPDLGRYLKAVSAFEQSSADNAVQAEKAYQAAIRKWPGRQAAIFALGNNYLSRGKTDEAMAVYREILEMNPDHVAAANNLAEILARKGFYSHAFEIIDAAIIKAEAQNSPFKEVIRQTREEIRERYKKAGPNQNQPFNSDRANGNQQHDGK